ncbi:annexin A1-like [Lissotriton helveticus]
MSIICALLGSLTLLDVLEGSQTTAASGPVQKAPVLNATAGPVQKAPVVNAAAGPVQKAPVFNATAGPVQKAPVLNATAGPVLEDPDFYAAHHAANLERYMKAKGVDEDGITDVLTRRNNAERQLIKYAFREATRKSLEESVKKALSGHYLEVVLAMLKTPARFDADQLKFATKIWATDRDILIEILASRNNTEIKAIRKAYKEDFYTELSKDINDATSGYFRKTLLVLAKGDRSEDTDLDDEFVDSDAGALYEAGEKRKGTDANAFINILTTRSFSHLRRVFQRYLNYSKHDLKTVLYLEFGGDLVNLLSTIVQCAISEPAYFALQLFRSMKGDGTRDRQLIRIMVSRHEVDMNEIKAQYKRMYGKALRKAIRDDTNGDYGKILVSLCGSD